MTRPRSLRRTPSRLTTYTAAATVAVASVTAVVLAAGPAVATRSTAHALGSRPFGPAADVAGSSAGGVGAGAGQAGAQVARTATTAQRAAARRRSATVAARRRAAHARSAQARAARAARQRAALLSGTPQQIAMALLPDYGWQPGQFGCLNWLWTRESGWNPYATNPYSGAYGIPQSLPASKMASAGPDWQTNPATQIRWGLGYIRATYGSPCGAWAHEGAYGWY